MICMERFRIISVRKNSVIRKVFSLWAWTAKRSTAVQCAARNGNRAITTSWQSSVRKLKCAMFRAGRHIGHRRKYIIRLIVNHKCDSVERWWKWHKFLLCKINSLEHNKCSKPLKYFSDSKLSFCGFITK